MKEIEIATAWGYEIFYECEKCGAIVGNQYVHRHRWQSLFKTVVSWIQAYVGVR